MRIRLVGQFAVVAGPGWLAGAELGSRKARALLALLAVERGRPVHVDTIVEALWGAAGPARPADNVATLVSRLRGALDPQVIVGGRRGYRLGGQVRVDLWEATELTEVAERALPGDPRHAQRVAQEAVRLLADAEVFAEDPGVAWAEPARLARIDALRRARHVAASAALRQRQLPVARQTAQAAVAEDPFDEVAYRLLMRAHEAAGEPARALVAYERLRRTLAEELGIDPAAATHALHVTILRNATVPLPPRIGQQDRRQRALGVHAQELVRDAAEPG